MESVLAIAFPIVGLIAGSLITAWFLRRSSKESNDTNAFKVVTDQLFALNEDLRTELNTVKGKVNDLESKVATQGRELEKVTAERDSLREVNAGLSGFIRKLVAAWPIGSTPPSPDEPLNWESHP